jgi:hypothetical protein
MGKLLSLGLLYTLLCTLFFLPAFLGAPPARPEPTERNEARPHPRRPAPGPLAGCASAPSDPAALADFKANNDPLGAPQPEGLRLQPGLRPGVIRPVARAYVRLLPQAARDAVRNFVLNLNEPVVFANNVLQGQARRAGTTAGRFVLDTTLGVGGLFDFAGRRASRGRRATSARPFSCGACPRGRTWCSPSRALQPARRRRDGPRRVTWTPTGTSQEQPCLHAGGLRARDRGGHRPAGSRPRRPRRAPEGVHRLLRLASEPVPPEPRRPAEGRRASAPRRSRECTTIPTPPPPEGQA